LGHPLGLDGVAFWGSVHAEQYSQLHQAVNRRGHTYSIIGETMVDDHDLIGLDPFAILDLEALRLDAFFSSLKDSGWTRASRCANWTVRDVLGHLLSGEDYHRGLPGRNGWRASRPIRGAWGHRPGLG
jgi:mycothiol maleylpyruvate isomerase-like protein